MDVVNNTQPRSIYSAAFEGAPAEAQTYELAFWSFVDARYGLEYRPNASCSWEKTVSDARRVRDDTAARDKRAYGRSVYFTYWVY